jgi:hypothetical protein
MGPLVPVISSKQQMDNWNSIVRLKKNLKLLKREEENLIQSYIRTTWI